MRQEASIHRRAGYTWYVIIILALVNAVNYLDRMVLSVLAEPIKRDLHLSDTQLGLLTGVAFAIFYATFGIPVARYADKGSRVGLVGLSLIIWSGMTAMCGIAQNFIQLFAARVGVGAGEAGCIPACHSLIGDHFPSDRRSFAMGIFNAGGLLGMTIGLAFAGWFASEHGWRMTLVLLGVPGIILSLIVWITVREPRRQTTTHRISRPTLEVFRSLRRTFVYSRIVIAAAILSIATYGAAQWLPAFFMRSHGMSLTAVGATYPIANGAGALMGALLGGWITDRLTIRNPRAPLQVCAFAYAAAVPITLGALYLSATTWALVCIGAKAFITGLAVGPIIAAMINAVRADERATASAFYSFVASLAGFGIGPLIVGVLSDLLATATGPDSLRHALAIVILLNLIGAVLLLRAHPGARKEGTA